jgi:Leucine-rich repeat (LRR) protein
MLPPQRRYLCALVSTFTAALLLQVVMCDSVAEAAPKSTGEECHIPDREWQALEEFYFATDGDRWKNNENWLKGNPCGYGDDDSNNWIGVLCGVCRKGIRHVEVLALEWNELDGNLTESIGQLPYLQVLNLGTNNLYGGLPKSIGKLKRMRVIKLSYNRMDGKLPQELYDLHDLEMLDLPYNDFVGSLNDVLAAFPKLRKLNLRGNRGFMGDLSSAGPLFARMPNLRLIDCHWNHIGGSLPKELFELQELEEVIFSNNQLSGELPSSISAPQLRTLILFNNYLRGPLPVSLGSSTEMLEIELYKNYFTGQIPESWGKMEQLEILKLHENLLEGPLPEALFKLVSLTDLSLSNNDFDGTLPSGFASLKRLRSLGLHSCGFGGSIPAEFGSLSNLEQLFLYNNYLVGEIPVELGDLSELRVLHLARNFLEGAVPQELSRLRWLETLRLNDNRLNFLPECISDLHNLRRLFLHNNKFAQPIPHMLGYLFKLEKLALHNNKFTGERLPEEFGNLVNLIEITAHNNLLDTRPWPRIDSAFKNPINEYPYCENLADESGKKVRSYYRVCGTRNDFYCDLLLNESRHEWRESHGMSWDTCYGKCKKTALFEDHYQFMKASRYNDMYEIADKAKFSQYNKYMNQIKGEPFTFHPLSFAMPFELEAWKAEDKRDPHGLWLLKPTVSCCGQGIKLIDGPHDPEAPTDWSNQVIQRFVHPPFLHEGHKIVLRLFVMVTSFSPLKVYLFPDGDVFYSHHPYDASRRDRRGYFISDYFFTKKQRQYQTSAMNLFHDLKARGIDTDKIWYDVQDVIVKGLLTGEVQLRRQENEFDEQHSNVYEVLGYDILLDANLKPWVCEINTTPNLGLEINKANDPVVHEEDFSLKMNLMRHSLEITGTIDVQPTTKDAHLAAEDVCRGIVDDKVKALGIHPEDNIRCTSMEMDSFSNCLSERDVSLLYDFECEFRRRGEFEVMFPADNAESYLPHFLIQRRENNLLIWWHKLMHQPEPREFPTPWSTPQEMPWRKLNRTEQEWRKHSWSRNIPTQTWNSEEEGVMPDPEEDEDRYALDDDDDFDDEEDGGEENEGYAKYVQSLHGRDGAGHASNEQSDELVDEGDDHDGNGGEFQDAGAYEDEDEYDE